MHAKSYSDGAGYHYNQSPSSNPVSEVSASPVEHHFYSNHSRHCPTASHFSVSLKQYPRARIGYQSLRQDHGYHGDVDEDYEGEDEYQREKIRSIRVYACLFVGFILLFAAFCLILLAATKSYPPKVIIKGIVFEDLNVQAGVDKYDMETDMLTLNSTLMILYRNPATFFSIRVPSTPIQLRYFQLVLASGEIEQFTQGKKSQTTISTVVRSHQLPLYGTVPVLESSKKDIKQVVLPMNITLAIRSKASVLGKLVKKTFHTDITCPVVLRGDKLGVKINLSRLCSNFG